MVTIVNCGSGNLNSVKNAFEYLGVDVTITQDPETIASSAGIVVPGMGSFSQCMDDLRENDLLEALRTAVHEQKVPYLGICLGMQILCYEGLEGEPAWGLGWIPATCRKIPGVNVPHMGWNSVYIWNHNNLFKGMGENENFYFAHSYYVKPDPLAVNPTNTEIGLTAEVNHNLWMPAAIERDNIFGVQFHPEKSHLMGLRVLKNWENVL